MPLRKPMAPKAKTGSREDIITAAGEVAGNVATCATPAGEAPVVINGFSRGLPLAPVKAAGTP